MKQIVAWLPLLAIAVVIVPIYQEWQRSQLARPDYDDPSAAWQKTAFTKRPDQMQSEHWHVVPGSIKDGNTFQVQQQGRVAVIRLACIHAPPLSQPLGVKSREHLRSLLSQANNRVILTIADTDRQGRKVAEVNVPTPRTDEEKFIQYEMVATGLAYPYEKFADHCPNWDIVQQGVSEAKQNQRGVWTVTPAVKP